MKYLFVIQGEGRGHFTQALSLKAMLERNGHEVVAVMVGSSAKRSIPSFFTSKIQVAIHRFPSPNFLPSARNKKQYLLLSFLYNLFLIPAYFQSIWHIRQTIKGYNADIVVNFYEFLCGVTYGLFNPSTPMVCIAHQYYFLSKEFAYTGQSNIKFRLLNFYSRITMINARKTLALSFRKQHSTEHRVTIVPPLLRKEVLQYQPINGDYIHGYMLNSVFAKELSSWSDANKEVKLHFFWDKKQVNTVTQLTDNLYLHRLDDCKFIQFMAESKAYATTAGFESVCEAMYFQKPIMMVPTHIEQECNAIDAVFSQAGVQSRNFDLDLLLNFIPSYTATKEFKYWVDSAETLLMNALTQVESLSVQPDWHPQFNLE